MYSPTNRERRVGLVLDVEVTGCDQAGRTFTERTRSLNVSGGGIGFVSSERLQVGDQLQVAIDLPPRLRAHFHGKARYQARAVICRVERLEGQPGYRVGARFLAEIAL